MIGFFDRNNPEGIFFGVDASNATNEQQQERYNF